MASTKHTELKGEVARETLTTLAQQGAELAEFRPLSNGKGEYATFTVGGQVGPVTLPDGRIGYGRFTANVNLTRVGTQDEFDNKQRVSLAEFESALSGLPEEQKAAIMATLKR